MGGMRHETVTRPIAFGIDWKGLGYLTSIVSVLFLGAVAWPKDGDPAWHLPALIFGLVTSIAGMGLRYKAHFDEQREIRKAKAEARKER